MKDCFDAVAGVVVEPHRLSLLLGSPPVHGQCRTEGELTQPSRQLVRRQAWAACPSGIELDDQTELGDVGRGLYTLDFVSLVCVRGVGRRTVGMGVEVEEPLSRRS